VQPPFEISIDGVPRSHRDQRDMAIEAAAQLMLKYPNSVVAVKDLKYLHASVVTHKPCFILSGIVPYSTSPQPNLASDRLLTCNVVGTPLGELRALHWRPV
jgi:hypothetical protein